MVTIELKLADYHAKLAVSLKTWQQTLNKNISRGLGKIFKKEKILTLADVRLHAKKLRTSQDLSADQRVELKHIVAHANLQLVSRQLRFNQFLIDRKFEDIFDIAKLSRDSFWRS